VATVRLRRLLAPTARLRLTLLYAGTFLVLGTAVIGITYLLASRGTAIVARPGPGLGVQIKPLSLLLARDDPVLQQHSADLQHLLRVSWVALAIAAIGSGVLGWFASGRVLRPLRDMAETARTISAGSLGRRLALAGPDDEFKQLADTLDDLLARLESSFETQRRFVANASHELRTPLTLERTLLQVALADPDASVTTLRAACEELLASGRDQEALLESLLTLATSERGLERREALDLAVLADRVVTDRSRLDGRSIEFVTALVPSPMMGDPALIERLIGNLVDNAVRYNIAGGRVDVRTAPDGRTSVLSIANTGPIVEADELERVFEPFARLGSGRAAQADGHGLGLSIVRAIADAHGAAVTAAAQPRGGLAVRVSFETADGASPTA
jgi:signal transduction histidine kinase